MNMDFNTEENISDFLMKLSDSARLEAYKKDIESYLSDEVEWSAHSLVVLGRSGEIVVRWGDYELPIATVYGLIALNNGKLSLDTFIKKSKKEE